MLDTRIQSPVGLAVKIATAREKRRRQSGTVRKVHWSLRSNISGKASRNIRITTGEETLSLEELRMKVGKSFVQTPFAQTDST